MILSERTYGTGTVSLEWDKDSDYSIVAIQDSTGYRSAATDDRKEAVNLFNHTSLFEDRFERILDLNVPDLDGWKYDKAIDAYIKEA